MALHTLTLLVGGLVVLVVGAELLLRGATRLSAMLGIAPVLIGLLVVSVGTSVPELAVGLTSASEGTAALSVGNVTGANLINLLLILGISAWLRPLPTDSLSVRLDVPVMAVASTALFLLAMDGALEPGEGLLLLIGGVAYVAALVRTSRREDRATLGEFADSFAHAPVASTGQAMTWGIHMLTLAIGIAMTVLGADWLVDGAVDLASQIGVSQSLIGLTIVAVGTTMPELVTTLVATARNQRDVAIGNLVGSCIFNVLLILGVTISLSEGGIPIGPTLRWIDLPLAAAVALLSVPVFRTRRVVSRWEGGMLVMGYLAFMVSLLVWRT